MALSKPSTVPFTGNTRGLLEDTPLQDTAGKPPWAAQTLGRF